MKRTAAILALLSVVAAATPAAASTMPRADMTGHDSRYFGLGIGNGLSVSVDVPVNRNLTIGASLGTGLIQAETARYDVRGVYDFINGGRKGLSIAGIVGLWGGSATPNPYGLGAGFPILEIGFGLAYPFTSKLTGRLNLMVPFYGPVSNYYYSYWGGPAGGIELGYKFNPAVEGTLGSNGQGNLLGLKLNF